MTPHSESPSPARMLPQLSVRGRLIAMVAVAGTVTIACLAVAMVGLTSSRAKSRSAQSTFNVFKSERDAYEGWLTDDDQGNMLSSLAAVQDRRQLPLMRTTAAQVLAGYQLAATNLRALVSHAPTASLRADAAKTLTDAQAYNVFTREVIKASLAFDARRAVQLMSVDNVTISNRTQADFDHMGRDLTARAAGITASVGTTVSNSIVLVLVIAAIGLVLAIIVTVLVMRSITRPLAEVTEAAERIAVGDIDVRVRMDSTDEIGCMARAFGRSVAYLQGMTDAAREIAHGNLAVALEPHSERDALGHAFVDMRGRIALMLGQIAESSQMVGSSSEQLARTGEQAGMAVTEIADAISSVAVGAENQVRSLADARRLTEEVTTSSHASAADAGETADAVRATRELARDGAEAVMQATDVIRSVRASSADISTSIRELGTMSDEIGGIVDTITAIAEQTNLLALNAAIEAARAGEQGRGFAVVADEVRKLAEESQTAAASIGALIAQIQTGTTRAVEAVAEGAQRAEQGVETVEHAREVFLRIDAGVQNMSDRVERITAAVTQIAAAGTRVQESIEQVLSVAEQSSASAEQVSATTEQTSASTQQIAASAVDLNRTAEQLQGLVQQFVLPQEG
jgi:methyl-accepting chemotaxis protein